MHTFCKKKRKLEQAQQPPSMEGQPHLTLGKKRRKNYPTDSLHQNSDTTNSGENKASLSLGGKTNKKEKKQEKKKKKEEKTTYSLPSLRERSETPGALDRRALGITGGEPVTQLPTFGFGPHYRLPAF